MSDNPPNTIYLQWNTDIVSPISDGVTWCQDKINDDDVEYVKRTSLVDAAPDLLEACKALIEALAFNPIGRGAKEKRQDMIDEAYEAGIAAIAKTEAVDNRPHMP